MPETRKKVLVCPLDWGLGHASRMIPVIHSFLGAGYQVILGGSGKSGVLLQVSFPELFFIPVPSPEIHYSAAGSRLITALIRQLPVLVLSVFREHRQIKALIKQHKLDMVVSDNRYGLFCRQAYCIFVTHQLSPVLPALFRWAEYPLYLIISRIILHYNECWIPDFPDPDRNLSGKLSHRFLLPRNAKYIGLLSRFRSVKIIQNKESLEKYEFVIILSGPEPQTGILFNLVVALVKNIQKKTLVITGFHQEYKVPEFSDQFPVSVVPHLDPRQFIQVLLNARAVICRSGYSGIMDLVALGKTALLVPTPGQPEQEYLAKYLTLKGLFACVPQDELNSLSLLNFLNGTPAPQTFPLLHCEGEIPVPPLSDEKDNYHGQKP